MGRRLQGFSKRGKNRAMRQRTHTSGVEVRGATERCPRTRKARSSPSVCTNTVPVCGDFFTDVAVEERCRVCRSGAEMLTNVPRNRGDRQGEGGMAHALSGPSNAIIENSARSPRIQPPFPVCWRHFFRPRLWGCVPLDDSLADPETSDWHALVAIRRFVCTFQPPGHDLDDDRDLSRGIRIPRIPQGTTKANAVCSAKFPGCKVQSQLAPGPPRAIWSQRRPLGPVVSTFPSPAHSVLIDFQDVDDGGKCTRKLGTRIRWTQIDGSLNAKFA